MGAYEWAVNKLTVLKRGVQEVGIYERIKLVAIQSPKE